MPLPIIAWICYSCIAAGATYCVHKVASSYNKNTKNKKRKLELKGKSIEQAREDNKIAQKKMMNERKSMMI